MSPDSTSRWQFAQSNTHLRISLKTRAQLRLTI